MKLKLTSIAMIALAVVAISSCKKDSTSTPKYMVKTETTVDGGSPSIETYTYDSNDRVVKKVTSGGIVTDYVYSGSMVYEISGTDTITHFLNSDGLESGDSNGNLYEYNSDGQRTVTISGTDTTYATYTDGNLTQLKFVITSPSSVKYETRTYDTGKKETRNIGDDWTGLSSTNLRSTVVDEDNIHYTYEFAFDANTADKISSETRKVSGVTIKTKSYTY